MSVPSMTKRASTAVLTAVLVLGLAACGSDDEETSPVESPSASAEPSQEPTEEVDDALLSLDWSFEPGDGLSVRQLVSVEDDEWLVLAADDSRAVIISVDPRDGAEMSRGELETQSLVDSCTPGATTFLCTDHEADTFTVVDRVTFETTQTIEAGALMGTISEPRTAAEPLQYVGGWFWKDDTLTVLEPTGEVSASWTGAVDGLGSDLVLWNGDYYHGGQILRAGGGAAITSPTPVPETVLSPTRAVSRNAEMTGWVLLDENLAQLGEVEVADVKRTSPVDPGEGCALLDQTSVPFGEHAEAYLLDRDTFAPTPLSEKLGLGSGTSAVCLDGTIFATLYDAENTEQRLYSLTSDGTVTLLSDEIRQIVNVLDGEIVLAAEGTGANVLDLGTVEILEEIDDMRFEKNNVSPLVDVSPLYIRLATTRIDAWRFSS